MLEKETAQLTFAHAHAHCQFLDAGIPVRGKKNGPDASRPGFPLGGA